MKSAHVVSLVLGIALLVSPNVGEACSCGPNYPPSVLDQYNNADAAFTGIVTNVVTHETYIAFYDVEFHVTGVWKGVSSPVVHVLTGKHSGSCGIGFSYFLNLEFVVYAYADYFYPSGPLYTHSCTRTTGVENAQEDFDVLGDPRTVPLDGSTWGAIKALYE